MFQLSNQTKITPKATYYLFSFYWGVVLLKVNGMNYNSFNSFQEKIVLHIGCLNSILVLFLKQDADNVNQKKY